MPRIRPIAARTVRPQRWVAACALLVAGAVLPIGFAQEMPANMPLPSEQMPLDGEFPSVLEPEAPLGSPPGAIRDRHADDRIVALINQHIRRGWEENDVSPSDTASDAEWLRRVYLDLAGHIPPAAKVEEFLDDKSDGKRAYVVDALLDDPDYVRNFTEVWTNLLIGRATPQRTSRAGMRKFLREAFARNRPWNDVVHDLLTAEGHFEENGAVNFLLAQLDGNPNREDYHVEATARATRLFLGLQVQCTQCHNHPFNEWKQNQFWEFDSFFKQVRREDTRRYDPQSGRMVDDFSELVYQRFDGPVYFETRGGLMQVAYPTYFGKEVPKNAPQRRADLARLICEEDPQHTLARAMVNRMWGHFLGYGFTRPVDDMGPHNPPSHPELLDKLTAEFVAADYDVQALCRWICNSEAYGLTSRLGPANAIDNPSAGETPLFSHAYVKTMEAEQLYDSLLVATQAERSGAGDQAAAQEQRERWLREFLRIFGGEENGEPTLFAGSIPQALLLMNGDLVKQAIDGGEGAYLRSVLTNRKYRTDAARINALYLASLGRPATAPEMRRLSQVMRHSPDPLTAYQDLYWALLNSNEFVLNH